MMYASFQVMVVVDHEIFSYYLVLADTTSIIIRTPLFFELGDLGENALRAMRNVCGFRQVQIFDVKLEPYNF